jgi:hypothetical protein
MFEWKKQGEALYSHFLMKTSSLFVMTVLMSGIAAPALADVIDVQLNQPALDRWMYPFNSTPGTRTVLTTFGSDRENQAQFDARDGQILLAFDTGAQVPIGSGQYEIIEAEISISCANDMVVQYDPTSDPWQMFLPAGDSRRVNDPDAGQPIELAGVGFRGGFTAATFKENSAYAVSGSSSLSPGVRNAFAACYDSANNFVDMSNHPREGLQPNVFAVGQVAGLSAGQLIAQDTVMTFQVNVTDANIQNYLRQGIQAGRTFFSLSSLTIVAQQAGNYPAFYSKENAYVQFGLAQAAQLSMKVQPLPACIPEDLNCSGVVDSADLGSLLGKFGPCVDCPEDFNKDGFVDSSDLGRMLGAFGQ